MSDKICSVEGCDTPVGEHGAKGMCPVHYSRWKKWGNPFVKKRNCVRGKAYKGTPVHNSYSGMKARCMNPNNPQYKDYGGRGIKICDRWLGVFGFENFLKDMGEPPKGTTLDRINVNGPYSPENCRWATPRQQCGNKRIHRGGSSIPGVWKSHGKYWAASLGIDKKTIVKYFKTEEEAILGRRQLEKQFPDITP